MATKRTTSAMRDVLFGAFLLSILAASGVRGAGDCANRLTACLGAPNGACDANGTRCDAANDDCVCLTRKTANCQPICWCVISGLALSDELDNKRVAFGSWRVDANSGNYFNRVVSFTLAADAGNIVQAYYRTDLDKDGNESLAEVFTQPEHLSGTIEVAFGNGPDSAIPIRLSDLDLAMDSGSTNAILDPNSEGALGSFDATTGIISFDRVISCVFFNDRFPSGKEFHVLPRIVRTGTSNMFVVEFEAIVDDICTTAVPSVSNWGMVIMSLLVLCTGSLLYRWRHRAACSPP